MNGPLTTNLTIVRMRNLQKDVAGMGLSQRHRRRELTTLKMAAMAMVVEADAMLDLSTTQSKRNRWEEYVSRMINAESTIQLHRALVECAAWLDMLDDWQTSPPQVANDQR